jgi:hypothetical protein
MAAIRSFTDTQLLTKHAYAIMQYLHIQEGGGAKSVSCGT